MNSNKIISGFKWSLIDTFSKFLFTLGVSTILARLLEPKDFGLIAMGGIFIAISRVFVDGGMGDSLMKKKDSNEADFNTVFSFNFIFSIILYAVLFLLAPLISLFFEEPRLVSIVRVTGLGLIVGSLSIVQIAILRKQIDFKKQAKISLLTSIIGGICSVLMAYFGFQYWSLILPVLLTAVIAAFLYWYLSPWKPKLEMDLNLFKEHMKFSSFIMFASLSETLYSNFFFLIIGKLFSAVDSGYFYRADNIQKLPSSNIDLIVRQVTYPILSNVQDDKRRLFIYYDKMLSYTAAFNSFVLLLLSCSGNAIILVLFGNKWIPSVHYFQLLCFAGLFFPLISINNNMLNVNGRSDVFFKLTMFRLLFLIPVVFLAHFFGMEYLIYGIISSTILYYFVVIGVTHYILQFNFFNQLKAIGPGILHAVFVSFPVFFISKWIVLAPFLELVVLAMIFAVLYVLSGKLFNLTSFLNLERILLEGINQILKKKENLRS